MTVLVVAPRTDNWARKGDQFSPVGEVVDNLPAGMYEGVRTNHGEAAKQITLSTDRLQTLKSSLPTEIVASLEKFLGNEDKYKKLAILYKRGILLHGPPGNGKTLTTLAIAHSMIKKHDAVVFSGFDLMSNSVLMRQVRKTQPTRPILNIMEDMETLRHYVPDQTILNMLDGTHQINKVVHIATTNYLKRLDPRYMGRPGRFDEVHLVGEPSTETVREYVVGLLPDAEAKHVDLIVTLAKGFPMAYVKELVIGIEVQGQAPDVVANRLREMFANAKTANKKQKTGAKDNGDMDYYDDEDDLAPPATQ